MQEGEREPERREQMPRPGDLLAVDDVGMGESKESFKHSQVSWFGQQGKMWHRPNTGHMREKQAVKWGQMSYNSETGLGQRQSSQGPVFGQGQGERSSLLQT